ncbi:hypothetical protein K438DRAFT_1819747 [Mycena galopus ATCC 62051]|nr:hypothetical protein K438DRAFT_1819747 [Mycena galopus ATCC 62051]
MRMPYILLTHPLCIPTEPWGVGSTWLLCGRVAAASQPETLDSGPRPSSTRRRANRDTESTRRRISLRLQRKLLSILDWLCEWC